jgi:hypothetical protein
MKSNRTAVCTLALALLFTMAGAARAYDVAQVAGGAATPIPASASTHTRKGFQFEPANARLKIISSGWVMEKPWKTAKKIEPLEVGKVLMVTGSTRDYLEVRLKSGVIGYVEPTAVELVKPADTSFMVTRDSPVYQKPNRFARKVADVVPGKPVKVTGIALDYVRIRLRSGVVGFLPMSALQ